MPKILAYGNIMFMSASRLPQFLTLHEKQFVATELFLGTAGIGATPTVMYSGSNTTAAPTNGTVGAVGNTSRPYK